MGRRKRFGRLGHSLAASAGDIVFGMEDGTVSIFGLVLGVAATTNDTRTVLIAGASGAVAAAVSMMAGTYLDVETAKDQARQAAARLDAEVAHDPATVLDRVTARLGAADLAPDKVRALAAVIGADNGLLAGVARALAEPARPDEDQGPFTQSLWMLVADFLAAAIPIVPFTLMPVRQARVVSAAVTLLLLVALGVGRAKLGGRSIVRTVAETVSIGIAAALAGVAIGHAIAIAFGG